jgi:hypothetical protein
LSVLLRVYPEAYWVEDGKGGKFYKADMQALAKKASGPPTFYIREIAPRLEGWIKGELPAKEEPQEPPGASPRV